MGEITLANLLLRVLLVISLVCLAVAIGLQTGRIFKKREEKDDH